MRKRSVPDKIAVQNALADLAHRLPDTPQWLALVRNDGILIESYGVEVKADRVGAMTAATGSLQERIAKELDLGDMRYSITAGTDSLYLVAFLGGTDYWLGINLWQVKSWDTLLSALWGGTTSLISILEGV